MGVANVSAFDGNELAFTANTLTESSLTIGLSAEDVRGGTGAGLLGRYFHTSTFELTLTDALFNLKYIGAAVGADVETGADILTETSATSNASGEITFGVGDLGTPKAFCNSEAAYVWARPANDPNATFASYVYADGKISGLNASTAYCIKYLENNANADYVRIKSDYIPNTYRLVLKENLYQAGESNSAQTKVGYVQITIPRFQLDGSQDLSMSMTGASTTSLKGSALISEGCGDANCDGTGYYADMIQVLEGADWTKDIIALAIEGGDQTVASGATKGVNVYAVRANATPRKLIGDALTGLTLEATSSSTGIATTATVDGYSIGVTGASEGSATFTVALKKDDVSIANTDFDVTVTSAG